MREIQRELDAYLPHVSTLAYARDLPQARVDLRRLVVVPRMLVNAEAYRRVDAVTLAPPTLATVDGGHSLRTWFVQLLVDSLQTAIVDARPSFRKPLATGDTWIVVAVNEQFEWSVPRGGPCWPGHYYVLELMRSPITRAVRKATRDAMTGLEEALQSLSRMRRNEILRLTAYSLGQSA